jgi:hypothetical protein
MDIDVLAGSVATLKKNGYKILQDGAFKRSLRLFNIEDIEINDPDKAKQTSTTQRFRFALITPAGIRLPTRIEFSRRTQGIADGAPLELIDPEIARQYRKLSYRCRHYSGEAAVVQKIKALAGRTVTQARDVFDLAILFTGGYTLPAKKAPMIFRRQLAQAIDCLIELTWEDYRGQVVEFLNTENRSEYGSESAWETLQALVLDTLGTHA